jgi:membrane protease YdiL (CAAX protease family)
VGLKPAVPGSAPGAVTAPGGAPPPVQRRELLVTWAKCLVVLAVAKAASFVDPTGMLGANLAGVAAFVFVAFPDGRLRRRGEHWDDYGLEWWGIADPRTWRAWARGTGIALVAALVLFPPFAASFWAYAEYAPSLPGPLARALAPYWTPPDIAFRLPSGFPLRVLVQLLVVALPEEMFYRGWMQTAWARTRPERRADVLGAKLGPGFFWTQLLFAAGHLVVLQPWRLATFFPGLFFGWLRERSGGLAAPVVFHAISNLFIAILEASFYG